MKIKSLFVFAVVVAIGVIVASPQAQAGTMVGTDATVACANDDLLQTGAFGSFSGTFESTYRGGTEATLRDGVAYTAAQYATEPVVWPCTGTIWTYTLNTTVNTLGYDLSQVNTFFWP
jgi:hypothetical protein